MPPSRKKLGELLVDLGVIDEMQLKSALGHQRSWGGRLGAIVVEQGYADEDRLVRTLASHLNVPVVRLSAVAAEPRALELMASDVAKRLHVLPLRLEGANLDTLVVAMSDPTDLSVVDQLQFRTGKRIAPVLAGDREIGLALERDYDGDQTAFAGYDSTPAAPALDRSDPYADAHLLESESDVVPGLVARGHADVGDPEPVLRGMTPAAEPNAPPAGTPSEPNPFPELEPEMTAQPEPTAAPTVAEEQDWEVPGLEPIASTVVEPTDYGDGTGEDLETLDIDFEDSSGGQPLASETSVESEGGDYWSTAPESGGWDMPSESGPAGPATEDLPAEPLSGGPAASAELPLEDLAVGESPFDFTDDPTEILEAIPGEEAILEPELIVTGETDDLEAWSAPLEEMEQAGSADTLSGRVTAEPSEGAEAQAGGESAIGQAWSADLAIGSGAEPSNALASEPSDAWTFEVPAAGQAETSEAAEVAAAWPETDRAWSYEEAAPTDESAAAPESVAGAEAAPPEEDWAAIDESAAAPEPVAGAEAAPLEEDWAAIDESAAALESVDGAEAAPLEEDWAATDESAAAPESVAGAEAAPLEEDWAAIDESGAALEPVGGAEAVPLEEDWAATDENAAALEPVGGAEAVPLEEDWAATDESAAAPEPVETGEAAPLEEDWAAADESAAAPEPVEAAGAVPLKENWAAAASLASVETGEAAPLEEDWAAADESAAAPEPVEGAEAAPLEEDWAAADESAAAPESVEAAGAVPLEEDWAAADESAAAPEPVEAAGAVPLEEPWAAADESAAAPESVEVAEAASLASDETGEAAPLEEDWAATDESAAAPGPVEGAEAVPLEENWAATDESAAAPEPVEGAEAAPLEEDWAAADESAAAPESVEAAGAVPLEEDWAAADESAAAPEPVEAAGAVPLEEPWAAADESAAAPESVEAAEAVPLEENWAAAASLASVETGEAAALEEGLAAVDESAAGLHSATEGPEPTLVAWASVGPRAGALPVFALEPDSPREVPWLPGDEGAADIDEPPSSVFDETQPWTTERAAELAAAEASGPEASAEVVAEVAPTVDDTPMSRVDTVAVDEGPAAVETAISEGAATSVPETEVLAAPGPAAADEHEDWSDFEQVPSELTTRVDLRDDAWSRLGIEQPAPEDAVRVLGALVELLIERGLVEAAEVAALVQAR